MNLDIRAPWSRRRHDTLLLVVVLLVVAGLTAETLLRVNGMIPTLMVSQMIFGTFVSIGIGGTAVLAYTVPVPEGRQARPRSGQPTSAVAQDRSTSEPNTESDARSAEESVGL